MKKIVVLASVFVLFSVTTLYALCTTNVPGGTISGETWTEVGSPYCVEGDVIVNNLIIDPGVHVEFTGNFEFEIAGVLTAVGTKEKGIIFTTAENVNSWMGIFFNDSLPGSELAYVTVENSADSGLEINNSQPTIRDSIIQNNQQVALKRGGGIWTNAPLTLTRCTIDGNSVSVSNGVVYGGGIFSQSELILHDTKVSNNTATANAPFSPSSATAYGAGIYTEGTLTLEKSVVDSNVTDAGCAAGYTSALSRGGGLYAVGKVTVVNSLVTRNKASASGFCSFNKSGGGLYLVAEGDIIHTTVADNVTEGLKSVNETVTVVNSIFWNNTVAQISGLADVSFSDVQDSFPGDGNIDQNPLFLIPDPLDPNYDVHIDPFSPCIDEGTNTFPLLPPDDIDGQSRPEGIGYDMGADEYSNVPPPFCTLNVLLSYTTDFLNLEFSVGTSHPATWNVWISILNFTFPLWSVPLPAIYPPVDVSLPIPSVPSLGTIGILTTLTTPEKGIICSDWESVDTGPISTREAAPTARELKDLFKNSQ